MVFAMRTWSFNTHSDTESRGRIQKVVFILALNSVQLGTKALRILSAYPGVQSIGLDRKSGRCSLVGFGIDAVQVGCILRKKICYAEILSVTSATELNYTFPTTVRITELQPEEDTDLERKRSLGMLISEEQQEQSEKQPEDQPPPGQADCYISQVKASLLSHPLPSMSLPLASEARSSPSPVSPPSRGTSDQMQTTSDHGINGIGELKRHYDLHAGEQASRLKEVDDTVIMLRKQVEEPEAKVSLANTLERCLRDMLRISEARHAGTERALALMQEEMDKVNRRIEYLENEKTEARASRASIEGETISTPGPSPPAPRITSLSYVPLLLLVLVSRSWKRAGKALFFLNVNSYLDILE